MLIRLSKVPVRGCAVNYHNVHAATRSIKPMIHMTGYGIHRSFVTSKRALSPLPPSIPPPPPPSNVSEIIELLNTVKETAYALSLAAPLVNTVIILSCGIYVVYKVRSYTQNVRSGVDVVKKTVGSSADAVKHTINEANNAVMHAKQNVETNARHVINVGEQQVNYVNSQVKDKVHKTLDTVEQSTKMINEKVHEVQSEVYEKINLVNKSVHDVTKTLGETNEAVKKSVGDISQMVHKQSKDVYDITNAMSNTVSEKLGDIKKLDVAAAARKSADDILGKFWKKDKKSEP